ncbi:MAG: class I SAM-dependent methyltransferase [Spirosomataceae bacterium]
MLSYFKSIFSLNAYYHSMQKSFLNLFGTAQMLHYPLYKIQGQTLLEGQENLTSYCIDKLGSLENKTVVDIGCGNGVQSFYIFKRFNPQYLTGIELNSENLKIAQSGITKETEMRMQFVQDNAEVLEKIEKNSTDIVICIESAFHYDNKQSFIEQVNRILKPSGKFLIADLLLKPKKRVNFWERKVKFNLWSENQYKLGFSKANLNVGLKEDLSQKIIAAFSDNENWFQNQVGSRKLSWYFSLCFAKLILKLYSYQLKSRHSYILFVGSKEE